MGRIKGRPMERCTVEKRSATLIARGTRRKKPLVIDGEQCWVCSACRHALPADNFYPNTSNSNGLGSQCRKCHGMTSLATRDPEKSADSNREYMHRARANNPDLFRHREKLAATERRRSGQDSQKRKARAILNRALLTGAICRPSLCSECSLGGIIQGHHHDYSKPLSVEWLCSKCHGKRHRTRIEYRRLAVQG